MDEIKETNGQILTIVICRHPEHKRELILPIGGMKAIALAHWLKRQDLEAERLIHSGTQRTLQAACFMMVATNCFDLELEKNTDFNIVHFLMERMGKRVQAPGENQEEINAAGNKVEDALEHNSFARRVRTHLLHCIQELAQDMVEKKQRITWIVSHGQFSELAVTEETASLTPYGINHCDCIIYQVSSEGFKVVKSTYVPFETTQE
ncbi:hypothetical protein GWN26_08010 [Candidatus Saccharibacteria bacterium]|nr:hypothetical protein [Candidatus Saccharibacteria bacterium]NIV03838.1 hypothetical protein [Calditrichia bacterium]NIS38397.1 hypothetical protein [Candidatus Saccharibacteria bacterium]NIV72173.1 hypothetical protein [Calditrichia bacterium]NIV99086.1 hypothetical protein [Candidatus Saccharibacteria bacterium]